MPMLKRVLNPNEQFIIFVSTRIIAGLSIFPLICILITYFRCHVKKNFALALHIQLLITQVIGASTYLFPIIDNENESHKILCHSQVTMKIFSIINTNLLIILTLLSSYIEFFNLKNFKYNTLTYKVVSCVLCWVISITVSFLFLLDDLTYNKSQSGICESSNLNSQFVLLGPITFLTLFSNLIICRLMKLVKVKNTNLNKGISIKVLKRLILYNLPIMLTFLLMLLAIVGKYVAYPFIIVFIFENCWASLGCIYIVLFCFDGSVIEEVKKLLCCNKKKEENTNEVAPLLPEV